MSIVWVDDVDVEDFGLKVVGVTGYADAVELPRDYVPIPGRVGGVISRHANVPARRIVVELVTDDTVATRREPFREFEVHCSGLVQLRFGDASSQYVEGLLVRAPKRPEAQGPWWTDGAANMVMSAEFVCHTPAYFDTTESEVTFTSSPEDVALGTLPSGGVIVIEGPATDPVLTYRDAVGAEVESMTFDHTVESGDSLTVDLTNRRITTTISGVEDTDYGILTDGDFFFPSPADGDYGSTAWPTLEVSSGSGTYTYRKAYRS